MGRKTKTAQAKHDLGYQLRELIEARGLTPYAVGRLADPPVDPGVVSRFLRGERDLYLETAGRLAAALGLRLVEVAKRGRARPSRPAEAPEGDPAAAS
jgi:Helix-turn-helix